MIDDTLVTSIAQFGLAVAGGEWQLAEMALAHREAGTWKEWKTINDTHPSTFDVFVDDFSQRLRTGNLTGGVCLAISSGKLLDLIDLYSWMTALGFDQRQMTFLGFPRLKKFRAKTREFSLEDQQAEIVRALAILEQNGEADLFNDDVREIKPELIMERLPDGRERLLGLTLWVNGAPQKNVYSPEKANWLTKRLRARKTYLTREQWTRGDANTT
jgi:hypothetical protein